MQPYDIISKELVPPGDEPRYIGNRSGCRFCGVTDPKSFGQKKNAHAFPEALGNKRLFSLDECKACNSKFSIYEDSLAKALGPFLTLGGVKGKNGVRQTGRSGGKSLIRHDNSTGKRELSIRSQGDIKDCVETNPNTGIIQLRMPIVGDKFIPQHAFKALCKMAITIMPFDQLCHFKKTISWLGNVDENRTDHNFGIGFSYAYVGNAPSTIAGTTLRRKCPATAIPYMIFIFTAGSVCLQIQVPTDVFDTDVPCSGVFSIRHTSQLRKPDGGWFSIKYSDPIQFNWASAAPILQHFEAFQLDFNPITTTGTLTPILRQ